MNLPERLGISDAEARALLRKVDAGDAVAMQRIAEAWVSGAAHVLVHVDPNAMIPKFVVVRPHKLVGRPDLESARFDLPKSAPSGWRLEVKVHLHGDGGYMPGLLDVRGSIDDEDGRQHVAGVRDVITLLALSRGDPMAAFTWLSDTWWRT